MFLFLKPPFFVSLSTEIASLAVRLEQTSGRLDSFLL